MHEFITPPQHYGFTAKKLFDGFNRVLTNGSIAYIEPRGGGPSPSHSHVDDHLFIVIDGTATIKLGDETIIVKADESIVVPGATLHSIWNETEDMLKMIGLSVYPENHL